jgi:diamine N-acetyltransferase
VGRLPQLAGKVRIPIMTTDFLLRIVRFKLKGKRVIIRSLRRDDIDKRLKWQKYHDPLYFHYNIENMTQAQKKEWYQKRKKEPGRLFLAIDNIKEELIGFLSLYNLNWEDKKAYLGIYLGYEYTDKGYGTETIKTLLPYYFEKMKFKELDLDVASLNHRAIKCYLKCGFESCRTKFNRHDPRSKIDIFGDERFKDIRRYFKKEGEEILVQFEEMRITEEMWKKQVGSGL